MKFKEHALARQLLSHLEGIEIGGSAHNPFNLPNCRNVDYTDDMNTVFKTNEEILCGEKLPVDIVANGDDLPLEDESVDYVISSHVFEHFFDPIAALKEWFRVVRPGGYVFIIVPNKQAIAEEDRDPHPVQELIDRHEGRIKREDVYMGAYQNSSVSGLPLNDHGHWTVFSLGTLIDLCQHYNYDIVAWEDPDKKVGNGICIVLQK